MLPTWLAMAVAEHNLREAASRGALDDKPCGTNEEDAAAALRELRYLRERRHRAQ